MQERSRRFHAALKLAGLSIAKWASAEGVTRGHVYQVLSGTRESPPLIQKVEAFIAEHLPTPASDAA